MDNYSETIYDAITESIELNRLIQSNEALCNDIRSIVQSIIHSLQQGGKVLLIGNGGSASAAEHIAAEFTGRFLKEREPLYAEALHTNSSYLTAVANDYSFAQVYSRAIMAKADSHDVLIAFSTSGNSENILKALDTANSIGLKTIGFTGTNGGNMVLKCKHSIQIPSTSTPRIQEAHIMIGHIIVQLVEEQMS